MWTSPSASEVSYSVVRQIRLRILRTDVLDLASVTLQVLELLQVVLWDGGRKALAASEQEAN